MPNITEADLKKQIKAKQISPVYLLCGSEQMYVRSYARKLEEAIAGKSPSDFNLHRFAGEVNLTELAAATQVVPFMSEYNLVTVSDIFLDSLKPGEFDTFRDICAKPVEGTILIISFPSYIANPNRLDSLAKAIAKKYAVCKFDKQNALTLEKSIAKWANQNGKLISRVAADKLIALSGGDLTRLKNEVDKICNYASGEEVSLSDIDRLATVNLESRIFDLSDAVLQGNGQKAFQVLDLLFSQREEPIAMLVILSNAYIDAYRMRVASECGVTDQTVAEDFGYGKRTFVLKRVKSATSRVSTEALRKSVDILIDADLKFKSVKLNQRVYLEQLIELIRQIAAARGIVILTDSDGAGFVIRNFLKGAVPKAQIKNCYIPQLAGKEKRKAQAGKEGLLGVEGMTDEVIIEALRRCGATILGEEAAAREER